MICTKCGVVGADLRPNRKEGAEINLGMANRERRVERGGSRPPGWGGGALVPSGFREPHCSFGEEQSILLCRRGVLTLNADDIPATRRRIPPWQS